MDFHGMKRKQLQALCKKHGVAANLTNREMADRLASIFKENEGPILSAELRSNTEEICSEDKANSDKKQIKKVRFSPDNQTIEYEVSVYLQPKRRSRRQTLSNNPAQILENAVSEDNKKFAGCQSRVTRSRVQNAVEEEIHMVSSSPVGRKRGRGGKKIKDAEEVANIDVSEGLELAQKDDVKNGHDKVTGGLSGRQLRSRKNVVREDSKKIRNDKGSGEVHLLDEGSDGKNGQEQSMKNARKGDQGVAFSSDVEKVEVVSRVTRQSRAQSKDAASIVKNEVKIVEAKDENETEKPLRRTKRNSEKDCAKRAVSVISDSQVTKVQEQSESDIALVEPPECLRRHSSRQKSVGSQSDKRGNKEEFPIEETRKRSRTTALEAILEDSSEVERDKYVVTSQQQSPLRRSRRKTLIITAPAAELANKEDIGEVEHLGARILGQGMTEELDAIVEDGSEVDRAKFAVTSQHQAPLRRSRRKTVIITSPAAELANKEDIGEVEHLGAQLLGKGMTEELDAIVEDGSEVDRAKYAVNSQHQAPLRRGRRKTEILTAPSAEVADKEDIGRMEQLRVPLLGKGTTEELQKKSSRNSSLYSLSGTSKEDQTAVAESDQGVEQQILEPISEEEEPMKQIPQRRSRRITSKSTSVAPPNSTAKGVKKKGQSKSRMETVEEEPAPTESLPSPGELPAEKDEQFVVSECAGNKNNLDLDVSKQVVKSGDACSNKSIKELRRNSGAKKQCGFAEASPRFLNMEEDNDSAGNMDETLTASPVKLVRSSKDKEMNQSAHKSPVVYEKESNLVEDDVQKIVNCGKFESEDNCMSSQTVHKTCLLDDANWSDLKHLKCVSKGSLGADSSLVTFPAESHGNEVSDQEMKEDIDLMDVHSSHEYLVVYKEDRALVESEVHVDAADSEMNHNSSTRFLNQRDDAVTDSNGVKPRLVEFESNVINMDELTSRDNGHSLADRRDLTGAASTFLHSEKELGTELPGGENTDFTSDNVTAAISRTPFGEAQIIVELEDTNVTAAESVKEGGFDINKSSEIMGLKSELENFLKTAEEMIATDVSHREGIPHIECSVEAAENQESSAQSHSATAETDAQKMLEIQQSSYSNTISPGTPFGGPAPGNQLEDMCRAEAADADADAVGRGMFDQKRNGDPNPGNEPCIHDSVVATEENTGLVKNAEEIRIHDDYFESESSPSSNRTDAVDDSNLVESRIVGSVSRGRKAFCSEIASVADVFSSDSQGSHAGKTSSRMEPKKVLEMQEPSGNLNSINYNMDAEGISTPVVEDQIKGKLENANMTIADSVEEVIFNDLLNELGESIGLKRGSEIPSKTSEKLCATMLSDGERIILTESSVKAEKQEHSIAMDAAAISGTPNTTEMKCRSSSDIATHRTSVGLAPQSQVQDKLCSAEITSSLMEDEKEKQLQDDTIMAEIKNQPFLSLNKTGSLDDALVEVESNSNKVVSSGMTYLADFYSSVNQTKFSGETSNELNLENVLDLEESSMTENVVNYTSDQIEVKEDTSLSPDQSSMHLEDTDIIAAEPIQKVVIQESDKMEVKEVTSPAQEDQSSMHLEDTNMTAAGPVQDLVIWESDKMEVKEDTNLAPEDQSLMHLEDTNMTPAGPVLELVIRESDKMEVNEDTNLAPEDQVTIRLEDTNIAAAEPVQEVFVWESDKIEVKEDTSLAQEDQSSLQLEDTNITATEPTQEVVYRKSDKIEVKEDTILAQGDHSSVHLEDTDITAAEPAQELVFRESDKTKVKEDTSFALEDQNSKHLEDISITAAEPVHEVVFRDRMNKVCESESEVSLKKAEETGTYVSSGIVTVHSESSVETNDMSEATGKKTVMSMQWSLSSHDNDLISPLRTQVGSKDVQGANYRVEIDVSNAGCAVLGQLNNEENVNTVENEDTINSENFVSGKKITDQSSEEKYRADDIYHPLLESIDSQCAKDEKLDISDGSFDNVSDETQEKHTCEVLDEGTDPVSLEEKGNDILESASHGICNDKLPDNGCLHAINDMQEKPEAVCMDTGNEIQANALPLLAMMQLDDESQTLNQGAEIGEVNARAFSTATQALPAEGLTTHITSESFSMNPFDHVLVDGETNASGERGVGHPFINGFAATMDDNGIRMSGETDVQEDNIAEKIVTSPLKVELTDYTSGNVDAKLYDHNMSVTDPIFQDTFGVPSTGYLDEMANAPVAMEAENYGDLDDQGEEVGLEHDHSSSFKVDGLTSTVGLTVDSISVVATLESTLNSSYPQSGTKVDDPDIKDSDTTKQLDCAFTIDQARVEDGEKSIASHQRSLHGGEEEDASSSADTPCSKLEISIAEKRHPQVMDDINNVVGTEVSTECKVTTEERDGCQTNSGCFNDVIVGAKSDDCEVSMKTDTDLNVIDNSDVNQSPCLDERKNCNLETEEPNALHFPETEDGDSDEREHLENPDESNIFTNMEMLLFFGVEDEVKNSDAKAGDSNDVALDMAITECNSSDIKEGDYIAISDVEDTNFSVRKDGPEDTETMELRNDFSGLDAAMADKSPLLKGSAIGKGEDGENAAAFRTELNLLNATAEKGRSNSVPVRQLISSIMKSKSKSRPGLIQRTPKLPIFHDMKENECSSKREQLGNRTTPKTSSKLRPPLRHI
ncbi:hypothetical protein HRI_002748600 [Hibiscus trionum]|uniref:Uncharacterized protein n=1 Tax=Hibiscus trionum TaxID=183268 RepID=A0A9W7I5F1_HIBTR|nr:hypothetical protein HRI_002748600 [Hibiscus trionum]